MRGNVVFYVTRQYMKKNRKRTLTAFFGIFFMVMLMTCVFVGKETAFDFLERMAVLDQGKWHVSMYDLQPEEAKEVQEISWVQETARSETLGMADFPESGNESRPYLNIKAYETPEFDWMNIQLKEGRLPENDRELVVSSDALTDGASLKGRSGGGEVFQSNHHGEGCECDLSLLFSDSGKRGDGVCSGELFLLWRERQLYRE